jgi:isopentenyl diphosphate isomerase/L-lactate dehydrogenase-like FMN-dependent dehydrogenase
MGHTYRSPMILGPTGLAGVLWRWDDLQIARHGVERAINMLQQEIDITQALLGVPELSKIDRSALLTSHEPSSVF